MWAGDGEQQPAGLRPRVSGEGAGKGRGEAPPRGWEGPERSAPGSQARSPAAAASLPTCPGFTGRPRRADTEEAQIQAVGWEWGCSDSPTQGRSDCSYKASETCNRHPGAL